MEAKKRQQVVHLSIGPPGRGQSNGNKSYTNLGHHFVTKATGNKSYIKALEHHFVARAPLQAMPQSLWGGNPSCLSSHGAERMAGREQVPAMLAHACTVACRHVKVPSPGFYGWLCLLMLAKLSVLLDVRPEDVSLESGPFRTSLSTFLCIYTYVPTNLHSTCRCHETVSRPTRFGMCAGTCMAMPMQSCGTCWYAHVLI